MPGSRSTWTVKADSPMQFRNALALRGRWSASDAAYGQTIVQSDESTLTITFERYSSCD